MKTKAPKSRTVSTQIIAFLESIDDYGLSLRGLASETGLDVSNLSKAARGLRPVSRTEIDAICEFMEWTLT